MRNAKKLMLLLLSLALLCGIFAVAALAEEPAKEVTVVYPDGATDTFAVGETITPKTFTDGLYYGKGNTLFKDDATEGWSFTLDGAALADLTVTDAMAGKKIIASGANKVYYVTEEKISTSSPAVTVYHLINDVDKYMSSANKGDRGDGTNTGASSREVLGNKATESIKIKLYSDVVTDNFYMILMPSTRQNVGIPTALDLNGHNVINNYSGSTTEIKGTKLFIYSSVPGANWYQPNTTNAFYASDDGTLYLGNDTANDSKYSNNISFFTKSLFHGHWGGGASIFGGHYYQLPGTSLKGFVSISRRVSIIRDASFYALAGYSVFSDENTSPNYYSAGNATSMITNCKFYGTDSSAILTSSQSGKMVFDKCSFYGLTGTLAGAGTGFVTATSTEVEGGTNTFLPAISYKTVTWYDGTTSTYYAETLDDAKAFVESHPFFTPDSYEVKNGNELFVVFEPVCTATFDENLNATVTRDGEQTKVYYTITYSDGSVLYYTNADDYQAKVQSYFGAWDGGATLTLYADVKFTATGTVSLVANGTKKAFLDLNGHTITFSTASNNLALDIHTGTLYVYSSTAGGKLYAPTAKWFTRSNSAGMGIFGERDTNSTQYGKNLTVETTLFNTALYGSGIGIYGGTYIQTANSQFNHFITVSRENEGNQSQFINIRNATFILNKPNSFAIHWLHAGFQTIANCTFISNVPGTTVLGNATTKAGVVPSSAPILANCDFVNILPVADLGNGKIPTYQNCRFSLENANLDGYTVKIGDATETQYLAKTKVTDKITVGGVEYPVNYVLAKSFLTVEWDDGTHPYWALGSSPISDTTLADTVVKQADGTYLATYDRFYIPAGVTEVTEDLLGTTVTELEVLEGNTVVTAFSYQVAGERTQYAPLLATPAENGAQFVALLNNLSDVKIVMYTDIELSSGVLFGTLVDAKDSKGNAIQKIDQSGDVDWDLNGFTVTVAADATPILMSNYGESEGAKNYNVLHFVSAGTFKLYSSVPGGKYVNNSKTPIFGALKYISNAPSYILGTSDLAVNGGDNLTIDSKAAILIGYENNESGPAGVLLGINGGTYVYHGNAAAFSCGGDVRVYNAKILTTNAAVSVFISAYWGGKQSFRIENSTVVAMNSETILVDEGYLESIATGEPKVTHTVTIKDVTFAGGALKAGYKGGYCTFVFEGKNVASDAAGLAVLYPEAPAGTLAAYSSVTVYGVTAKTMDYYSPSNVVTVRNEAFGTTEYWLAGSAFLNATIGEDAKIVFVGDVYYYRANPVWTATVDGVVVSDVCALENAGKTVILTVTGETVPLYFTVTVNGEISYYTNAETVTKDISAAMIPAGAYTYEIKLYSDIDFVAPKTTIGKAGVAAIYKIDANGFTFRYVKKQATMDGYAFVFTKASVYWYSSVPGGVFDISDATTIACTDGSGHGYFGEPVNDKSTTYGKNVTFYYNAVHPQMYSNGVAFIGGTYIQVDGVSMNYIFDNSLFQNMPTLRNSTFIVKDAACIFKGAGFAAAIENCNFICEEPTELFTAYAGKDRATTFVNCNFYNVIANALDVSVTYENCNFSLASPDAQTGGYIAYTGELVTLTIDGKEYTFGAALVENAALVNWGFGISEYWAIDAEATHEDVVINTYFLYAFEPLTVAEGENVATATLKAIANDTLKMSLTLQDKIGLNLFFAEGLKDAKIFVGGTEYPLTANEEGKYVITKAIAPNVANAAVEVVITIGENDHVLYLSVGSYASKILATDAYYGAVHNLTYAMVEYVRAMTDDADFLAGVASPAGYEAQLPGEATYEKGENKLLTGLRFNLSGTIALEIAGAAAEGEEVNLVLATGRSERANVVGGSVVFAGLYVNEFAGEMKIHVGGETYTYSIENYYNALDAEDSKEDIAALYNYAQYAQAYVNTLTKN